MNNEIEIDNAVLVEEKHFCSKCGYELKNENFCPQCGMAVLENLSNTKIGKQKSSRKFVIIFLAFLMLLGLSVVGFFVFNSFILPDKYYSAGMEAFESKDYNEAIVQFEKAGDYKDSKDKIDEANSELNKINKFNKIRIAYNKCDYYRTTLSSDRLSITVDSEDKYDIDGLTDIKAIISSLNLPDSLIDEMLSTNALMGRQSENYNDIEVSWSYHPDNGLDAIFKIVE